MSWPAEVFKRPMVFVNFINGEEKKNRLPTEVLTRQADVKRGSCQMETDTIKAFIQKIPFFEVFNDHELNKLVGKEKVFKDCKKGETIFKEGDSGAALYVLLFGEIELVKSYDKGPDAIIMEIHAGSVFGEIAMLTKRNRNLAARASSTKVVVMEFPNTFIDKYFFIYRIDCINYVIKISAEAFTIIIVFPCIKKSITWKFSFSAQKRPLRSPKTWFQKAITWKFARQQKAITWKKKVCLQQAF